MLVLVFLLAIAAILVAAGSVAIGRGRQFNDVERFHRARGITTGWARNGMTRPVIGDQSRGESAPTRRRTAEQERGSAERQRRSAERESADA